MNSIGFAVFWTGVLTGGTALAFVSPTDQLPLRDKSLTTGLGQMQVVRPFLNLPQISKSTGHLIKRDTRNGAVRLVQGLLTKSLIEKTGHPGQDLDDYLKVAREFLKDYPEYFPGLRFSDLKLVQDALIQDRNRTFLKMDVYRDGLLIQGANVDFRFVQGNLVQVVNQSFSELPVKKNKKLKNLTQKVKGDWEHREVSEQGLFLKVTESEQDGYQLIQVSQYSVQDLSGETFTAFYGTHGKIVEAYSNHHYAYGYAESQVLPRSYKDEPITYSLSDTYLGKGGWFGRETKTDEFGKIIEEVNFHPDLNGFRSDGLQVKVKSGNLAQAAADESGQGWVVSWKPQSEDKASDPALAQSMIYYHTQKVEDYAKNYINIPWFNQKLTAFANHSRSCNAFWNGRSINFFIANGRCANSANIADVIYHEWGHGLDANTGGIADGAFSEGIGDILSMLMTESPLVGPGFFLNGDPVRNMEPDRIYPEDRGAVHAEGLIIGGTFWDLLQVYQEAYGREAGKDKIAILFFKSIQAARKYTDVYDAVLALDDDDGSLENGTPNFCLLNGAFARHGLAESSANCD